MRDEFYADHRDLWKWTEVLKAAGETKKILYVAMLRPDTPNKGQPEGVASRVWKFFEEERRSLNAERKCARVTRLSASIEPFFDSYRYKDRHEYSRRVAESLRSRPQGERHVVFLDPDTGIGGGRPGDKHVPVEQIGSVWSAMREGDILLIYQHNARVKQTEWVKDRISKMAAATGKRNLRSPLVPLQTFAS
jgi:hypothetical protein